MSDSEDKDTVEAGYKKALKDRSTQQGVVRSGITRIREALKVGDASKWKAVEDLSKNLLDHLIKHDKIMDILRDYEETEGRDITAEAEKAKTLTTDSRDMYQQASDWVLSIKTQQLVNVVPERGATGAGGDTTEKQIDYVRGLEDTVKSLQDKMGTLDNAMYEITSLRAALKDQEEQSRRDAETFSNQYASLKSDVSRVEQEKMSVERELDDERYRASRMEEKVSSLEQEVTRYSFGMPGGESTRASISQQDMVSLSRVIADSNATIVEKVLEQTTSQHKSFYSSLQTPKIELPEFDGTLTDYHAFISRFDDLVGDTDASDALKLNTLIQYCDSSVRRHLECCNYKKAADGLVLARDILKTKYGNPFLVSQAWVKRMTIDKKIKTPEEVMFFASELRSCQESMTALGYLSDLENTSNMQFIVSRVPSFVQNRWRKINREKMKKNERVKISDLVDLIADVADEMTDPVYGNESLQRLHASTEKVVDKKPFKKRFGPGGMVMMSAAESSESRGTSGGDSGKSARRFLCAFCKETHYPRQCPTYTVLGPKERLKLVLDTKLCILCLGPSHMVKECGLRWTCQKPGCNARHNTTLHEAFTDGSRLSRETVAAARDGAVEEDSESSTTSEELTMVSSVTNSYTLPIIPIHIEGRHGWVETNAMIDTGASMTFMTRQLMTRIGALPYATENITMQSMTDLADLNVELVNVCVKAVDTSEWKGMFGVAITKKLPVPPGYVRRFDDLSRWSYLENLRMPKHGTETVEVLIGQSNSRLWKERRRVDGPGDGCPYAVRTPIGWMVMGHYIRKKVEQAPKSHKTNEGPLWRPRCLNHVTVVVTDEADCDVDRKLLQNLERFWKIEEVPNVLHEDPVNASVVARWNEETTFENGHVYVPIPIMNDPPNMPNSYRAVKKRFESLTRRLEKNDDLCKQYVKQMQANFDQGFAEVCTSDPRDGYLFYHPQQAVISDRRPGKCRIVGDLGIVVEGRCLNKEVHQGPNYTANIVDILIKFRQFRVAITGDIKEMYNQVRVPENQRDLLRFLWWRDNVLRGEEIECRMCTQVFGGSWSPSASMHALHWVAMHRGEDYDEEVIKTIMRHFYVDDLIRSIWETDIGIRLVCSVRELLQSGGFELIKIGSNDRALLESVPLAARAKEYQELDLFDKEGTVTHTLGSVWKPLRDMLAFRAIELCKPATRRGVLSTTSSLYDPLGLIAPFILRAKLLLQKLCKMQLTWDEPIEAVYNAEWKSWLADVPILGEYEVPRWVGIVPGSGQTYRLHVFSDASETGYGAAVYLVITEKDGMVRSSNLLLSKAKVTPMTTMSIPRLELSAAVLGVKLEKAVRSMLEVNLLQTQFWTDSMIVLWYVRGQSWRFKTFVANRIAYLQEHTEIAQWQYVPTEINPADYVSRGLSAQEMIDKTDWVKGPDYLSGSAKYPEQPSLEINKDKVETKRNAVCMFLCIKKEQDAATRRTLLTHFSRWNGLVRCVCVWRRILRAFKTKRMNKSGLSVSEIRDAELTCFRMIQEEFLTKSQRSSKIFGKLFPYDKEGVIRVGGRLVLSGLTDDLKNPPILPDCHPTRVYIRHVHERSGHPGIDRTFYDVKQKVWILGGKHTIKKAIGGCVVCKRIRGRPHVQLMSPLPEERVTPGSVPFETVGLDYCGPIYVKQGRSMVKRYICTITCFQTRAAHFEVSSDLSTSSFIQALLRFIARRGRPKVIYSDNGTNFVGAKRELGELVSQFNNRYIGTRLAEEGIEWKFNVPLASHHGGVWERLNRSFRATFMAIAGNQVLTDEKLSTLAASVEQVINSRPLTRTSEDPQDNEVLTPEHFLNLRKATGLVGDYDKAETYRGRWKQLQYLSNLFWRKWTKTYLQTLQTRQKWTVPRDDLRVGEIILLLDESVPRLEWPLGRVVEVFRGRDGLVRSALVKTQSGQYKRPITKMVRLEVDQ